MKVYVINHIISEYIVKIDILMQSCWLVRFQHVLSRNYYFHKISLLVIRMLFQFLQVCLVRLHGIFWKRKLFSSPTYRTVILFPPNNGLLLGELQREMNYWKEDGKTETGEYESHREEVSSRQFKLQFFRQVLILFIFTVYDKNNVCIDQMSK